jgi:hypothetical protein
MNLRFSAIALGLLISTTLLAAPADKTSAQFNISEPTQIPGATLHPGSYSIRVLDHLQDRVLLRVDGNAGTTHNIFIAVPFKSLKKAEGAGIIPWNNASDGQAAVRGFDFGSGNRALEFVYPKDDAVALAKINGIAVLAVDPASEGKSPQLNSLSNDDMQMVTLWTLTPERVSGASQAQTTISAAKYQADSTLDSTSQFAQARKQGPIVKTLPHTASPLPLILILGLLFASIASLLRRARIAHHSGLQSGSL